MAGHEPDATPTNAPADEQPGSPFLVVGVGASAGDWKPIPSCWRRYPAQPGLALLLVSHLDPDHKSHLPEILGRCSRDAGPRSRRGDEGRGGQRLRHSARNHDGPDRRPPDAQPPAAPCRAAHADRPPVPVPGRHPEEPGRRRDPLRQRHRRRASASRTIKAAGGVTFAQDEPSARHPGMPRAAVAGRQRRPRPAAAGHRPRAGSGSPAIPTPASDDAAARRPASRPHGDPITEILDLLRARTGVDFTHYKQTTIRRRILRRMALRNLEQPPTTCALLASRRRRGPEPLPGLPDPRHPVLPRPGGVRGPARRRSSRPSSTAGRPAARSASGSPAAPPARRSTRWPSRLLEFLGRPADNTPIKILATDINEAALEKARAGIYIDNIEIDVSPERLRRFFVQDDGGTTRSARRSATCASSRGTTWPPTRRSAGST